jgi:hypothetical protein
VLRPRQAGNRAGTAITARHAVLANHYPLIAGDTLRFIASDNTIITRTVVQAARIFYNGNGTDAWMILFDSDLPASITPNYCRGRSTSTASNGL